MTFLDERTHTHFGYWYEKVADRYFAKLPRRQAARFAHVELHLHDPDIEIETLHHQHLLFLGSAYPPTTIVLFPQRIEENTKNDTARFDVTINCLTKATNDIASWNPMKS